MNPIFEQFGLRKLSLSWKPQSKESLPKRRHAYSTKLSQSHDNLLEQPLMTPETLAIMRVLQSAMQKFMDHQKHLKDVVTVQAYARGFLVRRRYHMRTSCVCV